jgi:CHAD domain-containing protein
MMTEEQNDDKYSVSPDCSRHTKEVAGITDMKLLAEMIGDLHYESLSTLLYHLSDKVYADGQKDFVNGRTKLSHFLFEAQIKIHSAHQKIEQAWKISQPFMPRNEGE